MEELTNGANAVTVGDLTPRQRQVVALLGRGLSYKAAAHQLQNLNQSRFEEQKSISERTVQAHATAVRDLLGSDLPPMRAVVGFYWENWAHFEEVA